MKIELNEKQKSVLIPILKDHAQIKTLNAQNQKQLGAAVSGILASTDAPEGNWKVAEDGSYIEIEEK